MLHCFHTIIFDCNCVHELCHKNKYILVSKATFPEDTTHQICSIYLILLCTFCTIPLWLYKIKTTTPVSYQFRTLTKVEGSL